MQYSHSDAELIQQPVGYWTWAAYDAIVTRTRGALAGLGLTQPQWWILAQVARAESPKTRAEVIGTLRGYLNAGEGTIGEDIDTLAAHGRLVEDGQGLLSLTDDGRALFDKAAALQDELWSERHAGISDEEYLATLKVLQRFIHNTGGRAWHH
ncbi:MarR family transcriptional regulator [Streptomyces sp. NPDC050095]|uniref:MarR family winged helix-turn-helix transcriptional regulator n=1 Tax=unclassified Streptomyces TaxID=2593676 RepID=UPI00344A8964